MRKLAALIIHLGRAFKSLTCLAGMCFAKSLWKSWGYGSVLSVTELLVNQLKLSVGKEEQ